MGGVDLVAGFRPELWREVVPAEAPETQTGFDEDVVGVDGHTVPATQHDAVLWLSGSAYDVIFDVARAAIAELAAVARLAGGTRDALTRFTHPISGAYYSVPSIEALRQASGAV